MTQRIEEIPVGEWHRWGPFALRKSRRSLIMRADEVRYTIVGPIGLIHWLRRTPPWPALPRRIADLPRESAAS